MERPRRACIRTFGCQMNVHDSEKVANLLHYAGYRLADSPQEADLLVVNTCSIREKAEHRLYSDLGQLARWKHEAPGRILGVGGCVAQQEGDRLLARFPQVDFVFGTHNLRWVPAMVAAAEQGVRELRIEASRSLDRFDLPERHPAYPGGAPGRAYVTVMEGCDLFCSFCIVPTTRGREVSRPAQAILAEAQALAARGVGEIVLLGQTVNAYGRHDVRHGHADARGTMPFAALLRRLARIPGLRRIRYTSPHPAFFDEELIRAHAELEALCPHVHLPLQSGSDSVLARMRRRYTADAYRRLVARLRAARPDVALTTDLIVGFPGETETDFQATLALVREVAFVDAYSFNYSPRPGTRAAAMPDRVPPEVSQERLVRLQTLQRALTYAAHRARVGEETEVRVEGPSRRGASQVAGRDPYHRIVNFESPGSDPGGIDPGDWVRVLIVQATPHSLIGALAPARPIPIAGFPEATAAAGR